MVIEGSALFVWLALEDESSAEELKAEITDKWPELGPIRLDEVQSAADLLVEEDLIEVLAQDFDTASTLVEPS